MQFPANELRSLFHGRAVAVSGQVWPEHCVLKKHFLGGADAVEISIAPPGLNLSGPSRLKRWWRSGQGGLPGPGAVQPVNDESPQAAETPDRLVAGVLTPYKWKRREQDASPKI